MSREVKGQVKAILATETLNDGFKKRVIVVTEQGEYPKDIAIEFLKDKVTILDKFKVGETVTVGINIQSREWQGKWFTNVNGWKINSEGQEAVQAVAPPASNDESDGLPF
mgnify:CR=1 FL=1